MAIDRTDQILTALAAANAQSTLDHIIDYYGFALVGEIKSSTNVLFWFYVTDEGSGDILVGVSAYEDGSHWRMHFQHYHTGQRPLDRLDLFYWREGS
jgi:hypothetical protein